MSSRLVLVPNPRRLLTGDTRIDVDYPRDYTPEQMRQWARDLQDSYAVSPETLAHWETQPADQLGPEQRRLIEAHRQFWTSDRGIKGSLRDDGVVELSGGRHRAAYIMELGVDPVPVWVYGPDQAVDGFARRCEEELAAREARKRLSANTAQIRADPMIRADGYSPAASDLPRRGAFERAQPPRRTAIPDRPEPFSPRDPRGRDEEPSR